MTDLLHQLRLLPVVEMLLQLHQLLPQVLAHALATAGADSSTELQVQMHAVDQMVLFPYGAFANSSFATRVGSNSI